MLRHAMLRTMMAAMSCDDAAFEPSSSLIFAAARSATTAHVGRSSGSMATQNGWMAPTRPAKLSSWVCRPSTPIILYRYTILPV